MRVSLLCGLAGQCFIYPAFSQSQYTPPTSNYATPPAETRAQPVELYTAPQPRKPLPQQQQAAPTYYLPPPPPSARPVQQQQPLSVTIPNAQEVQQQGAPNATIVVGGVTYQQVAPQQQPQQQPQQPQYQQQPVQQRQVIHLPPPQPAPQQQVADAQVIEQQQVYTPSASQQYVNKPVRKQMARRAPVEQRESGNMFTRAFDYVFGVDEKLSEAYPAPPGLVVPPAYGSIPPDPMPWEQASAEGDNAMLPAPMMPEPQAPSLPPRQEALVQPGYIPPQQGQPVQLIPQPQAIAAPVAPVAAAAIAQPEEPAQPQVHVYRSPQPIVRREVYRGVQEAPQVAAMQPARIISAAAAATLQPTAGGEPGVTAPLIPMGDAPQEQPLTAVKPLVVPPPAAAAAAPPPPPPPATDNGPALNALAPAPAVTPLAPSASVPSSAIQRWEEPSPQATPVSGPLPPVAVAPPAEPEPALSEESKKIAGKVPSNLGKGKAKSKEPVAIGRGKDLTALDKPVEPAPSNPAAQEAMGIKIEMKTPSVNQDYELEKAYNALISGQTEEAVGIYKAVLANNPNNKNALFGLATSYHRAGQLDLARPLYGRLLTLEPNHRDGLNNFLALISEEAPQEALTQLAQLEQRNPQFSPIPAQMAIIYDKMGESERANDRMMRAIELAPENLTYRYNFAVMLDRQRRYDEAGRLYQQIIEAYQRGEQVPGNVQKIQQRLTFISSNRP